MITPRRCSRPAMSWWSAASATGSWPPPSSTTPRPGSGAPRHHSRPYESTTPQRFSLPARSSSSGALSNDGHTASAELYDPAAATWAAGPPMLTGRDLHTATLLRSGAVLVAGGFGEPPLGFPTPVLTDAELSDPASGAWRRTGSLLVPHAGHTATRLNSGRVLVVDGLSSGPATPPIPNTELFDPESETWSNAGCTVQARVSPPATLLPSGMVLVAGGTNGTASSGNGTSSAELYGIVVSPTQVSLAPGSSQTFTASNGSGLGYVWSFLQNNSGGTLTAAG